jgi:hypothetical protein
VHFTVSYRGKILFEPESKTKKHEAQSEWKKVAMVIFDNELPRYYRWFLLKRFNLELNPLHREAHITFINDSIDDLNDRIGTREEKEAVWEKLKQKWNGKEVEVVLNLRPFTNVYHWWLIVDHKHRTELHAIRKEVGLGFPYFGLHMTFGLLNRNLDSNGQEVFSHQLEHSKYINELNELGFIDLNKDYRMTNEIEIKRISPERVDLYNPQDEILGTLFNEYELNHVRIQIASKQLSGYYIMWKGQKVAILNTGKLEEWPSGLYDIQELQLAELFKIQFKNKENEKH